MKNDVCQELSFYLRRTKSKEKTSFQTQVYTHVISLRDRKSLIYDSVLDKDIVLYSTIRQKYYDYPLDCSLWHNRSN